MRRWGCCSSRISFQGFGDATRPACTAVLLTCYGLLSRTPHFAPRPRLQAEHAALQGHLHLLRQGKAAVQAWLLARLLRCAAVGAVLAEAVGMGQHTAWSPERLPACLPRVSPRLGRSFGKGTSLIPASPSLFTACRRSSTPSACACTCASSVARTPRSLTRWPSSRRRREAAATCARCWQQRASRMHATVAASACACAAFSLIRILSLRMPALPRKDT